MSDLAGPGGETSPSQTEATCRFCMQPVHPRATALRPNDLRVRVRRFQIPSQRVARAVDFKPRVARGEDALDLHLVVEGTPYQ